MSKLTSKKWWLKVVERAVKTFFQSFVSMVATGAVVLSDVDWVYVLSAGALSAVLSIATSIATVPEDDCNPTSTTPPIQ